MYKRYVKQLSRRFCNFFTGQKRPSAAKHSNGAGENILCGRKFSEFKAGPKIIFRSETIRDASIDPRNSKGRQLTFRERRELIAHSEYGGSPFGRAQFYPPEYFRHSDEILPHDNPL